MLAMNFVALHHNPITTKSTISFLGHSPCFLILLSPLFQGIKTWKILKLPKVISTQVFVDFL